LKLCIRPRYLAQTRTREKERSKCRGVFADAAQSYRFALLPKLSPQKLPGGNLASAAGWDWRRHLRLGLETPASRHTCPIPNGFSPVASLSPAPLIYFFCLQRFPVCSGGRRTSLPSSGVRRLAKILVPQNSIRRRIRPQPTPWSEIGPEEYVILDSCRFLYPLSGSCNLSLVII
jgi:hypothetical protein